MATPFIKNEEKLPIFQKGKRGERGRRGPVGKEGPKVLTWNKEITLHDDKITKLVTFPYRTLYNIKEIDIVVEGKGIVTFSLVNKKTGDILAIIKSTLDEELNIISYKEKIENPTETVAILELTAIVKEHEDPVKFLSLNITTSKN